VPVYSAASPSIESRPQKAPDIGREPEPVEPGGHEFKKRAAPDQADEVDPLPGESHRRRTCRQGFGKRGVVHPADRCCHGRLRRRFRSMALVPNLPCCTAPCCD
jgi:hypothetical protein